MLQKRRILNEIFCISVYVSGRIYACGLWRDSGDVLKSLCGEERECLCEHSGSGGFFLFVFLFHFIFLRGGGSIPLKGVLFL